MTQSGVPQTGEEAFDTLKVIDAPNFLAGFDAVQNPGAWDSAIAQSKRNDEQRLANAKLGGRVINKVQEISPTLAKAYKVNYDKNEEIFKNRATILTNRIGATQEDMITYQRENEDNIEAASWVESLALEQERKGTPQGYDLARELRALHGRSEYHFKESLARNQALSAERDFWQDLPNLQVPDPSQEGAFLDWATADNSEKLTIWEHWLENQGVNNVNDLDGKFLSDNYWKKVNAVRDKILGEASEAQYINDENERFEERINQFRLAAGTDNLGSKFLEMIQMNRGRYLDARGQPSTKLSRKAMINVLDGMLTDELITPEQYTDLLETEIKNRATGKMEAIGKIWAKDFGIVQDRIDAAITKRHERISKKHLNLRNDAGQAALKAVEENGGYISEAEVAQLIKAWKENPETAGIPIPDQYKQLQSNTVEDKSDQQIVDILEANDRNGVPLGTLWTRIKDQDLRKKWAELARLDGETANSRTEARGEIGRLVDAHKSNTLGVAGRSQNNWGRTFRSSMQSYRKHYRDSGKIFPGDPFKRQEYALQQVKTELETLDANGESVHDKPIDYSDTFLKMDSANNKAFNAVNDSRKSGINLVTSNQIIPGTEEDFKQLELMQNNASITEIPARYYWLARQLKLSNGKGGYLDGWGIAALQYKGVTGKDLRLPGPVQNLYKMSPIIQKLLHPKGITKNRYDRGKHIDKNGGDFSQPETLNPLLMPAVG